MIAEAEAEVDVGKGRFGGAPSRKGAHVQPGFAYAKPGCTPLRLTLPRGRAASAGGGGCKCISLTLRSQIESLKH